MKRRGEPWSELATSRYEAMVRRGREIKAWREQEFNASRPSGLQDFYLAHHLCWSCKATGTKLDAVGLDGDIRLYEQCEICGGTGKITDP